MESLSEPSVNIKSNKKIILETKEKYTNLSLQTNRYKFNDNIVELLKDFVKIHNQESKKDYKESWKNWLNEENIKSEMESEKSRLIKMGMTGDILDKMYKSARYYYSKQLRKETTLPKERKQYIGLSREILYKIDEQILRGIKSNIKEESGDKHVSKFTPAKSYLNYIEENPETLKSLIEVESETIEGKRLQQEDATKRLKKTYKNRFYNIKLSLEKSSEILEAVL